MTATTAKPVSRQLTLLRSLIYMAYLTATTMFYCVVMLLTFVLPLTQRYWIVQGYAWLQIQGLRAICGLHYRVEGKDRLPSEPAIIFSKHQSTYETFVLLYELPHSAFVAKRELLWVPFFGWGMAALRYITIDRSAGRKAISQMIEQAEDRFAHGLWVTIFPEGTRKSPGDAPDYKAGGAILASKTKRKVVPVVHNSGEFWPRHSLLKWPGTVSFRIGPAIDASERSSSEILADAQAYIEGEYASMHQPERFPY